MKRPTGSHCSLNLKYTGRKKHITESGITLFLDAGMDVRHEAVRKMRVWPLGADLQEIGSKPPKAALVKSQGGKRLGKGMRNMSGENQGDEHK